MNFSMRTLLSMSPLLFTVACGGQNDNGQTQGQTTSTGATPGAGGTRPAACDLSCFDNCITCEGKSGAQCSVECASGTGGAGGTTGTGGTTTGTGGTTGTGTGGTTTGTGGTTGTGTGGTTTGTGGTTGTGTGGTTTGTGGTTGTGTQSYTFTMSNFTIDPGGEVYMCQDFANPFGKDIDALVSESFMTAGSHHMFLFRMAGITADGGVVPCPSGGSEFHEFVHTAQSPHQLQTYPAGVGRFMPASQGFRLMVHYLNTGTAPVTPTVSVRLDYVDPSQVTSHAAGIFLNWMGLSVPPGTSAITHQFAMPAYDFNILGGASHMHKRGVGFKATSATGGVLYEIANPTAGAWDEPPANALIPPLPITAGSKITVTCDYDNTTSNTYTFGDSANTNEMCIYAGSYYPAPGGTSIVQQCLSGGFCVSTL